MLTIGVACHTQSIIFWYKNKNQFNSINQINNFKIVTTYWFFLTVKMLLICKYLMLLLIFVSFITGKRWVKELTIFIHI